MRRNTGPASGGIVDRHHAGIMDRIRRNAQTFLDSGPQGYKASIFGLFMTLAL
jgi:hypothetical protein